MTLTLAVPVLNAQGAKLAPDTLVFVNEERLTGELLHANADGITFKSAMAGDITVKWANIKQLQSAKTFAVIPKNVRLTRQNAEAKAPLGQIHVENQEITVGNAAVPVADANLLVDSASFEKAVNHRDSLFQGWGGVVTAGVSLVRATQNDTTFTGAINLVRSEPTVPWLAPRSRSNIDYNQAYGNVSQAGTPTVKTNIFHADAERDQYFSPRLFAFGSATFDHNFSQSLDLEQAYGGGVGVTVLQSKVRQLDFKGDVHYEKQAFFVAAQNLNLFGSTFTEKFLFYLPKGLVLNEFGSVSPSWNDLQAYSAHVNAGLGFPVYKGLGFNIGAVEDYLNNAPLGSKKNSTQFTTGLTYTVKPR